MWYIWTVCFFLELVEVRWRIRRTQDRASLLHLTTCRHYLPTCFVRPSDTKLCENMFYNVFIEKKSIHTKHIVQIHHFCSGFQCVMDVMAFHFGQFLGSSCEDSISTARGSVWNSIKNRIARGQSGNHAVYAFSQWEMVLYCNGVSHWLDTYREWSLKCNERNVGSTQGSLD